MTDSPAPTHIKLVRQHGRHAAGSIHPVSSIVPHGGHTDSSSQFVLPDGTHVPSDHAEPVGAPPIVRTYRELEPEYVVQLWRHIDDQVARGHTSISYIIGYRGESEEPVDVPRPADIDDWPPSPAVLKIDGYASWSMDYKAMQPAEFLSSGSRAWWFDTPGMWPQSTPHELQHDNGKTAATHDQQMAAYDHAEGGRTSHGQQAGNSEYGFYSLPPEIEIVDGEVRYREGCEPQPSAD